VTVVHERPTSPRLPGWAALTGAVHRLQALQRSDGSVGEPDLDSARWCLDDVVTALDDLAPAFPHDAAYLAAVRADLMRWGAVGVPDFSAALQAFHPEQQRVDGLEHLVVFPMFTQNGSTERKLEAVLLRVVWPDWLAELERTEFANPKFVPIAFTGFTAGYDSHSAVLFPESVSAPAVPAYAWGAIFCDREAARFQAVVSAAVATTGLELPAGSQALLQDPGTALEAFALWDLVHDRAHSRGDLPFDPFIIRQRMPFWQYALEELRCDLTAFRAALDLADRGVAQAAHVQLAILLDRGLRFPLSGTRVRNYDSLAGQLLFAHLHQSRVVRWTDNHLAVDWDALPGQVLALLERIEELYWRSIDRPKVAHWLASYALVAAVLTPHPASAWARHLAGDLSALPLTGAPKEMVDAVLPDEFPLSMFFEALEKKLRPVVAGTVGITGAGPRGTS
jgi:hypothetical protein